MSVRDYAAACTALTSLIGTHYRPTGHDAATTFRQLQLWLQRLELQDAVRTLSVIHVAGTKGKGSTCAFTESVLRTCGHRTGLFTSPHLVDIRERIQVDGLPVSEEVFATHFWFCYERLQAAAPELGWPPYFYFLTLLALRVFHAERVDVAVLEVGLGGRWDATNVVPAPAVCGITSLGYDHMEVLGHTLTLIAGEKAGILKPGVPAVTVRQPDEARVVVEARANELQVPLLLAPPLETLAPPGGTLQLGLAGAHQRLNAAMAVQLCRLWAKRARPLCPTTLAHEQMLARGELPERYARGLAQTRWPGRAQVVHDTATAAPAEEQCSNLTYFLDGAHTGESTATCAEWFAGASLAAADASQPAPDRVLVFNCMKEREPKRLLQPLVAGAAKHGIVYTHAVFVPVTAAPATSSTGPPDVSWQATQLRVWEKLQRGVAAQVQAGGAPLVAHAPPHVIPAALPSDLAAPGRGGSAVMPSTADTLAWLRRHARRARPARVHVLVTGSLYLVGDFLRLLRPC